MNKYRKQCHKNSINIFQKPTSLETVKRNLKRIQKNCNLYHQIQELELPLIYSHFPKDKDCEKQQTTKKRGRQFFSFKFTSRSKSNLFDHVKQSACKKRMSSLDVFNTFIPTQRYNPENLDQLSQAQKQLLCTNKFKNFKTIHHQAQEITYIHKRKNSENYQIYQKTFKDDSYNNIQQKSDLEQKKNKKKQINYENMTNFANDVTSIMTRIKKKRLNLKQKPINLQWIQKSKNKPNKKQQDQYSPWKDKDEQQKQIYQQMSAS